LVDHQEKLTRLEARASQIQASLASRYAELRESFAPVTIESVQRALPGDAALVELVSYRPFDRTPAAAKRAAPAPRYAAAVLTPHREPNWVDLGEARTIDELVKQARARFAERGSTYAPVARALDARVMQPVRR